MDVLLLAAMAREAAVVRATLSRSRAANAALPNWCHAMLGDWGGRAAAAATIGVGPDSARVAGLLLQRFRPKGVVLVGVAGGLAPRLRPGALFVPREAALADDKTLSAPALMTPCPTLPAAGRLLTVDRPVTSAAAKTALRSRYQADAVDMETHGVALACQSAGAALLVIRAIADAADGAVPPALAAIIGPKGSAHVLGVLGLLARPWLWPAAATLARNAAAAERTLREALLAARAAPWVP